VSEPKAAYESKGSTESTRRTAIVATAQRMEREGLAPNRSGNISCRFDGGLLITPSGVPYPEMRAADIVSLDLAGAVRSGTRTPSSESPFHTAIYRTRPDAEAIVHTHSPQATALACTRRGIPPFHYMIALAGGGIRCAEYATFGTPALAENALRALEGRRAVLLANHGVIALGADLESAYEVAYEVENMAGQYLRMLAAGLEPVTLDDAEMQRVLAQFARFGRDY
jgi:L-fuculose-phosphate aldolase